MFPRVLIRWLPTEDLQKERAMALGPRWSLALQQDAVDLFDESYADMAALAVPWLDGFLVVDVGFEAKIGLGSENVYFQEAPRSVTRKGIAGLWQRVLRWFGWDTPQRFDRTPNIHQLVESAKADYLRRGGSPESLDRKVANMRQLVAEERRRREQLTAEEVERHKATSIFTSIDRFNAVACAVGDLQAVPVAAEMAPVAPVKV